MAVHLINSSLLEIAQKQGIREISTSKDLVKKRTYYDTMGGMIEALHKERSGETDLEDIDQAINKLRV